MNLEKRVHPVFQSTLKLVPYQYKKVDKYGKQRQQNLGGA